MFLVSSEKKIPVDSFIFTIDHLKLEEMFKELEKEKFWFRGNTKGLQYRIRL